MISSATGNGIEALKSSVRGAEAKDSQHFDWPLAYDAEKFLQQRIAEFLALNSFARRLAERMRNETGTDFFEWIDHLVLAPEDEKTLREAGFIRNEGAETPAGEVVLFHPRATLPRILIRAGQTQNPSVIALRPEHVADFMARHNLSEEIDGAPFSRYRRLAVSEENGTRLEAVERRAYGGFIPTPLRPNQLETIIKVQEMWKTRRRIFPQDDEGFKAANRLLEQSIPLIGRDLTCQIVFEAERAYWESRNGAARVQKFRQDQLGLGWGNHDHHTFRSSREHFVDLIEFLLKLGFEKRERYYAGAEAGWGAQILEQAVVGIVVFADVDLMPDETGVDFSINRLPPAPKLGTVGLWVGLHGESFLDAGMHHLEARFDHQLLREQLGEHGIQTMKPFSDFDFLRQAFTEGERWPVNRERAKRLLSAGLITPEQFEQFTQEGALGSHLENLQRHGGFKGFNQKSVSVIIA
ncbi:MAG: hypothetical protein JWR19_972, partial [Pedosphaera sp.]|nr:hypothetical protein [Pedosphaera sp.]